MLQHGQGESLHSSVCFLFKIFSCFPQKGLVVRVTHFENYHKSSVSCIFPGSQLEEKGSFAADCSWPFCWWNYLLLSGFSWCCGVYRTNKGFLFWFFSTISFLLKLLKFTPIHSYYLGVHFIDFILTIYLKQGCPTLGNFKTCGLICQAWTQPI